MAKPIISKFSVIDATRENIVRYTCYDDTINEVKYIIYDNASGNIIVNQTVKTSGSSSVRMFMLPANLIHNRLLPYYLKIAVTNQNGNTSDLSDAVLFYCHEKPVLTFVDVEARAEKTIPFPAFSFNVEYKNIEEEGETLNLYKYQLYDSDKTLLHEEIYHGSISHAFNVESLDNNKVYYVRAVGETVNGYVLDTDFCAFRIEYDGQLQKLEIVAENEKREGRIKLTITKNEDEPNNFDSIRVKRREVGKYDWITIYEKKITSSVEPILIVCYDKFARGRKTKYQYYATSAGLATNAQCLNNDDKYMKFHWSGQKGQPTWLWGGNDSGDMYVYNPSNFNVNYATTAGNGTVDFQTKVTTDGYFGAVRFGNGVQICWFTMKSARNRTFLLPFADINYAIAFSGGYCWLNINNRTTTGFTVGVEWSGYENSYIAIGRWK